ncbi:MAG TPA: GNAT family N-acetyltransferase [Anaerolineales bacterium]|nr:GNAT family N-acetyltransferase [Anaerolineales bacterium]
MNLTVHPLTSDLFPSLEDLFGDRGPVSRCWCMYWRIGADYLKHPRHENKAEFRKIVEAGPPPGLLAFDGEIPVGWCQLTPRDALPWMDKTWRLKRVDDLPVWSLSCFYIRKGYRKKGVTSALIRAAISIAAQAGVPALEAYPLDGSLSPSATSTGYVTTFERLGFKVVARHFMPRPIMRYELKKKV